MKRVNLLILPRGSLYIMMSIFPRLTRCTESISSPSCRIWWPGRWWWRCMVFDNAFKQLSSKSWKRNECERTVRCMWRWISYWRPSGNFLRTCNQINHLSSQLHLQKAMFDISILQDGSEAFRTNFYIWCFFLCIQVSSGSWETKETLTIYIFDPKASEKS